MTLNRYDNDPSIQGGKLLGTNRALANLRAAVLDGRVSTVEKVLSSAERLDILAGRYYGDGRLWWIIAAASGIGWWLQCPAGTRILIPTDLASVEAVI